MATFHSGRFVAFFCALSCLSVRAQTTTTEPVTSMANGNIQVTTTSRADDQIRPAPWPI